MENLTTKTGVLICETAFTWLERECFEVGKNKLYCGLDKDPVKFKSIKEQSAYCMAWVTTVLQEVFNDLGIKYPFLVTGGTTLFRDDFKKRGGQITNNINSVVAGSVFYRTREGGGHVGIIIGKDNDYIYTIEANTTCKGKEGVCFKKYKINSFFPDHQILHVELYGTTPEYFYSCSQTENLIKNQNAAGGGSKQTKNKHRNYFVVN